MAGNVGGVWVWDCARAVLHGTVVAGGPSHALLADGKSQMEVRVRILPPCAPPARYHLSLHRLCVALPWLPTLTQPTFN